MNEHFDNLIRIQTRYLYRSTRTKLPKVLSLIDPPKISRYHTYGYYSREKLSLVADMTSQLNDAKMTVFAHYRGLSVADIQQLRSKAREAGVTIKVIKNRLVRVSMSEVDALRSTDTTPLTGQLLYAISDSDEVAPAQVLNDFAKTHPALAFAGAFSAEGALLSSDDVKALAGLPSKEQLIAQTIAQLLSPVHDVTNALSGNLHALLDGVEAKATS